VEEPTTSIDLTVDPVHALPTAKADPNVTRESGPNTSILGCEVHVWKALKLVGRLEVVGPLSGVAAMGAFVLLAAICAAALMSRVVLPVSASATAHVLVAGVSGLLVLIGGGLLMFMPRSTRSSTKGPDA
jgi:hypothetical protein